MDFIFNCNFIKTSKAFDKHYILSYFSKSNIYLPTKNNIPLSDGYIEKKSDILKQIIDNITSSRLPPVD